MLRKTIDTMLLFVVLVLSSSLCAGVSKDSNSSLDALFDAEWQARLERNPMYATYLGGNSTNHLLQDVSEKAYSSWKKTTENFINQLNEIDYAQLTDKQKINYRIFKQQLESRLADIRFKTYQMPFLADSGFHIDIMDLADRVPLKNKQDYLNYLARLSAIPLYFQQNIDNMQAGLKRNFSMPRVVMNGFTDVIKSVSQQSWDKTEFWKPMSKFPASISQEEQREISQSAQVIIQEQVIPAFHKLANFFETTYIPNSKKSLAAKDFPNGSDYYKEQIKYYTTLELSADEIHQIGLSEVARIRAEMQNIIEQLKFEGTFKEFLAFLRESPQFYAKSASELLKEAAYIAKKMDGQLPKFFTHLPRQPYTVEPVPDAIAPKYTTGRYVSAALNSEKPGTYWVNTYALDKRPLYVLEALTLHEAVPGHHLQHALNIELENLPNFRRYSYISAFGEGWGLYSEKLGIEAGFYQDPYSNFGRLTYEMWRAARLVIDTGIHVKGWSRDKAIKLLEENSALSLHNIRTEVDRYISWPGQALAYKLGELKILELRAKAEKELGNRFDLRQFHDEILKNGSIPLAVLEDQMLQYIERVKAESI